MNFFMIKKTFCDGWDNLLTLCVWNLIILAVIIGGWVALVATVAPEGETFIQNLPTMLMLILVLAVVMIPIFAVNKATAKLADFKSIKISDMFLNLKSVLLDAIIFGAFVGFLILLSSSAFPFYWGLWRNGSFFGLLMCAFVFWTMAITFLALQWYMPLKAQMEGGFFKTLKKCYILYFDNANFTFFMFLYTIVQIIFSAVALLFTIHGISGITLAYNNALRLRLYKYDWLEENPDLTPKERKNVPWGELIAEDKATLGPRNFRSFIYPWS